MQLRSKKKILIIIGSDLRNRFICSEVQKKYKIDGIIYQYRIKKKIVDNSSMSRSEKKLFKRHFKERDISEKKFFEKSKIDLVNINNLSISEKKMNSEIVENFIKKINPAIVIVYGACFLKKNIIKILPKNTFNIHSGITPRFKGDASNFWAFYLLEPNNAGATLHFLTDKIDSGPIVTQVRPKLDYGDNMHDVTNKSLIMISKKVIKLIGLINKRNIIGVYKQGGKIFYSSNFKPYHLKSIYEYYSNKIVDLFLKKKINGKNQKLIKLI